MSLYLANTLTRASLCAERQASARVPFMVSLVRAFAREGLSKGTDMKSLIATIFAVALLGATAADASVGVGVHVGGVGAGVNVGIHDGYHHHRRCGAWGWRHQHRVHYCRRWY